MKLIFNSMKLIFWVSSWCVPVVAYHNLIKLIFKYFQLKIQLCLCLLSENKYNWTFACWHMKDARRYCNSIRIRSIVQLRPALERIRDDLSKNTDPKLRGAIPSTDEFDQVIFKICKITSKKFGFKYKNYLFLNILLLK